MRVDCESEGEKCADKFGLGGYLKRDFVTCLFAILRKV